MKRIFCLLLSLMMLLSALGVAHAADNTTTTTTTGKRPVLLTQPHDQTVQEGSSLSIQIAQTGAKGITWRFYNPETKEKILASKAPKQFSGLKVSGQNSIDLRLRNIPASLDGWQVYCTLTNKAGATATVKATITVIPAGSAPESTVKPSAKQDTDTEEGASDEEEDDEEESASVDGTIVIQAIGCTLSTADEKDVEELTFDGESANFTVKATKSKNISYWVINGVKYNFNKTVKSIAIKNLTESTTFEVVYKSGKSQTLLTNEEIKERITGETLIATTSNAKMCHITSKGKGAGGYFKEFDFTEDYRNRATKKTVKGGSIDLNVKAIIPKGKRIAYWRFNGARFDFNSNVTAFTVRGLNTSYEWEPRFTSSTTAAAAATTAPAASSQETIKYYSVSCNNCTFSGGGYGAGTSGQVPAGTTIIVTPADNYYGHWSGSYNSTGNTAPKSISFVVNNNCSFTWNVIIN